MLSLFGEGLESAFFPCTLVLLVPGIAVTFASRYYSSLAIFGFTIGVVVAAWFRFSGRSGGLPDVAIAILMLGAGLLFLRPITERLELTSILAGTLIGISAADLWQPCTGEHFGQLLNELPDVGTSGIVRLLVYTVGLLAPLFILGAGFYLLPDHIQERIERPLAYLGALSLIAMAFATLIGIHEQVISQLFLWSDPT